MKKTAFLLSAMFTVIAICLAPNNASAFSSDFASVVGWPELKEDACTKLFDGLKNLSADNDDTKAKEVGQIIANQCGTWKETINGGAACMDKFPLGLSKNSGLLFYDVQVAGWLPR